VASLSSDLLLVGDIGGTKTDLLILSVAQGISAPLARARLKSAAYPDLQSLLREFLKTAGFAVKHACLDVAGPVVDGHAHLTNLPWEVDAAVLREELGFISIDILNDLAAIAHAIPVLTAQDARALNPEHNAATGTKAVIAPGTGLGEAFLVWDGQHYRPCPSEGGHADFAPPTEALAGLIPYLRQRLDHVSYEIVCSGVGIPHLYDYFRCQAPTRESVVFARSLAASLDRTPLIIERALQTDDPTDLCRVAMEAFLTILAAEAGNLALKVLALGGVYIAGGIPPRLLTLLNTEEFLRVFCAKGRFAALLSRIPVWLITNPDVALIGCAAHGLERLQAQAPGHPPEDPKPR